MVAKPTELFSSINEHAMYSVDLITRIIKALEPHVDYDLCKLLGENLHSEVCHAIGWDIDWDELANRSV